MSAATATLAAADWPPSAVSVSSYFTVVLGDQAAADVREHERLGRVP